MQRNALGDAQDEELIRLADVRAEEPSAPWYALHVQPRHEKFVARMLQIKGFEEYLPVYKTKRKWSDRIMETELPLFPGYVFCRFDWSSRILPALTIPGVLRVLGLGRKPLPIDEREMHAVRMIVDSGQAARPWPMPRVI